MNIRNIQDIKNDVEDLAARLESLEGVITERDGYRKQSESLRHDLSVIASALQVETLSTEAVLEKVRELRNAALDAGVARHDEIEDLKGALETSVKSIALLQHDNQLMAENRDSMESSLAAIVDRHETAVEKLYARLDTARQAGEMLLAQRDELVRKLEEVMPDATVGAAEGGIGAMLTLLARDIADSPAKNYVEMKFEWSPEIMPQLPFRKVAVVFHRDGGLSPAQMVQEAVAQRDAANERVAELQYRLDCALSALQP